MFHGLLTCSDADCDEIFEAWGTLEELESLACDCGCALQLLDLSEAIGELALPVVLEPCR